MLHWHGTLPGAMHPLGVTWVYPIAFDQTWETKNFETAYKADDRQDLHLLHATDLKGII